MTIDRIRTVETIPVAYPEPNDFGNTRHLLFVKLTADNGAVGWGEAVTMWPEASAATAAIVDGLAPLIIGADPREPRLLQDRLRRHAWWYGNGGIASFAISALDVATWDLAGHVLGVRVLDMIGGSFHERLPVLLSCHAFGADIDEMVETMAGWVSDRSAVGIKVGIGKAGNARLGYDLRRDVAFVAKLRAALGPDARIMIDAAASLSWAYREALVRARSFEEFDVDWLEEPLGADDPAGYARLRQATTLRIAYGEREWTPRGIERITGTGTVDVVGVDSGRCEGITGWLTAAAHCRAGGAEINAHAWSSAVNVASALALSLATPNCAQLEMKPLPNPICDDIVTHPVQPSDGTFEALPGPGLGIEVDEVALRRFATA